MQPRRSDIWADYEERMMKLAQDKESKELKKYKSEEYARVGSDDIEKIKSLYDTKPEQIKGMEYDGIKKNIMDIAHPQAVIIAPSYDPLNGLVENENERHNIIRNLITKSLPSGTTIMSRNASQELMMELIRVANDLDNAGNEELRVLADTCIEQLKKKALSTDTLINDVSGIGEGAGAGAGVGALVGGILGVFGGPFAELTIPAGITGGAFIGGVLGGAVAAIAKTSPQIQNIQLNGQKVLEELKKLESEVPEQQAFFSKAEEDVNNLISAASHYQDALDDLKMRELNGNAEVSPVKEEGTIGLAQNFTTQMGKVKLVATEFHRRAEAGEFAKASHSKINPIYWFSDDDIESVEAALKSLEVAMEKLAGTMGAIHNQVQEKMQAAPKEMPTQEAPKEENGGILEGFRGLMKDLGIQ
jgi:hypothetical protein